MEIVPEPQMNVLAVVVAAAIPMIMGFIYYHPAVAGSIWMRANGFTKEGVGNGPKPILYLVCLVVSFLLALHFWANVTGAGGTDHHQVTDAMDGHSYITFGHGAFHGMAYAITLLLPIFATMAVFEKRKFSWFLVNWVYWSITAVLMCGLLSAWR